MPDFRCYACRLNQDSETCELSPFESHHLIATNRARAGQSVVLFDGLGVEWDCVLESAEKRKAILKRSAIRTMSRPAVEITLATAIIKGKTFDSILKQATELGVTNIQPLETERTLVKIKEVDLKLDKWRAQLIEGCKQSGNPWLPKIEAPKTLVSYLESEIEGDRFVGSLKTNAKSWREITPSATITIFIGPEGDFAPKEYELLEHSGVVPISLGPYVLRSETAVVTAISQLLATANV